MALPSRGRAWPAALWLAWLRPRAAAGGAPGTVPDCDLRVVEDASDFHPLATVPVLMRFNASSSELSESDFLASYGKHPAAVYPRHVFEILQPYRPIKTFVAEQLGSDKHPSATPPPLVLSFAETYKGAPELRADLQRSFSLPEGWEAGVWSLSLGANGSGIAMHSTHGAVAASVLWGRKRWILAPPGALERVSSTYWAAGPTHLVPSQWPQAAFEELRANGGGVLECTQPPGTALFVPAWWWHGTFNQGDCLSVNAQVEEPSSGEPAPFEGRQAVGDRLEAALHGEVPQGELPELAQRALDALKADPLQMLRNVDSVGRWWAFFIGNDPMLRQFAAEVHRIAIWAHKALGAGTMLPEQCASLAFNLFPFGHVGRPPFTTLDRKHPARATVRNIVKIMTSALASGFADRRYHPHAGVLLAAMQTEAGRRKEAQAALDKHVGQSAPALRIVAMYAGQLSPGFERLWSEWGLRRTREL